MKLGHVMKQAMFLIAKTLPLVTWLGRVAPHTPLKSEHLQCRNSQLIFLFNQFRIDCFQTKLF